LQNAEAASPNNDNEKKIPLESGSAKGRQEGGGGRELLASREQKTSKEKDKSSFPDFIAHRSKLNWEDSANGERIKQVLSMMGKRLGRKG